MVVVEKQNKMRIKHVSASAGILIAIIIFFFLGKRFCRSWQQVSDYQWRINIYLLLVSLPIFIFCRILRALKWKICLGFFNKKISLKNSYEIMALSEMTKYIPGKIWNMLGSVYLARKKNIPALEAFSSQMFLAATQVISGAFLFFFFFAFFSKSANLWKTTLLLLPILAGIFFLHPEIFNGLLRFFSKKILKRESILNFRFSQILLLILLSFGLWLVYGIWFFVSVKAIYPLPFSLAPALICIYATSWTLGFLAFFVPSGLGIREGTLAFFLKFFVTLPAAIAISVFSRIWIIICDVVCAGSALLTTKL